MAKKMKKFNLIVTIACAVVFVVGALLLVLSVATPAGKKYTFTDPEDGEKYTIVFTSKEYYYEDMEELKLEYKVKGGKFYVIEEVLGSSVEVEAGDYSAFSLHFDEVTYTSGGAIVQFIIGCVLMIASAGGAVYFLILKRK